MTRRSAPRNAPGRDHRRGGAYVLVLATALIVTVIGLSALLAARVQYRTATTGRNTVVTSFVARSAVDLAMYHIATNPAWRSSYLNDVWTADMTVEDTTFNYKLVDELDGNLANDPAQPVRLYTRAARHGAVRIHSVVLAPWTPPNLLANPGFEKGLGGWTGSGLLGACDLELDTASPHQGAGNVLARRRSNQHAGPIQDVTDTIRNGATYFTEAWVRGSGNNNSMETVLVLDTSAGRQYAAVGDVWTGSDWHRLSGTLTASWTGTLHGAYWKVSTVLLNQDFEVDDALLMEGPGPPAVTLVPVAGTWRQEVE